MQFWIAILLCQCVFGLEYGRVQFSKATYFSYESYQSVRVELNRVFGFDGYLSATFSTFDGSAIGNVDYVPVNGQIVEWQDAEQDAKFFDIVLIDDAVYEANDELFYVLLGNVSMNGTIYEPLGNATIHIQGISDASYGKVGFDKDTYVVQEGSFQIPVLRTEGSDGSISVMYTVQDGSAVHAADFTYTSNEVLTWSTNDSEIKNITIDIVQDDAYELNETFTVSLHTAENASLASIAECTVIILGPNDVSSGSIQFKADCFPACASSSYVVENGYSVIVAIERTNGSDGIANASYSTLNGTAMSNVDYESMSGIFSWADQNSDDQYFVVQTLRNAASRENKTIELNLFDAYGASLGQSHASTATITIISGYVPITEIFFVTPLHMELSSLLMQDHVQQTLNERVERLSRPWVVQEDIGTAQFRIRRFGDLNRTSSALWSTSDGMAIAGTHYVGQSPTLLSWEYGDAVDKIVSVNILNNNDYDITERNFFVKLSNATNSTLGSIHLQEIVIGTPNDEPGISTTSLDMHAGTLTLILTHDVLSATFDPSKLQLHSTISENTSIHVQFTTATSTSSADGSAIVLSIGHADLNAIKATRSLGKSQESSFIHAKAGLFEYVYKDCVGFSYTACQHPIFSSFPQAQVNAYTVDTAPPTIDSFTLDIFRSYLNVQFSEYVERNTFCITCITLFEGAGGTGGSYTLSSSSRILQTGHDNDVERYAAENNTIRILIGVDDLTNIRATGSGTIGVDRTSTYLSATSFTASDMALTPNWVQEILPANAMQAATTDCTICHNDYYISASCTTTLDRICAPCSTCKPGEYITSPCITYTDSKCTSCSTCAWNEYSKTPCSSHSNHDCALCTLCKETEYEVSPCTRSSNRVCESCATCDLTLKAIQSCQHSSAYLDMIRTQKCSTISRSEYLLNLKSHRCGAGRCSCHDSRTGNANREGRSFPNDPKCDSRLYTYLDK